MHLGAMQLEEDGYGATRRKRKWQLTAEALRKWAKVMRQDGGKSARSQTCSVRARVV
jgi:hypothetical protein